MLFQFFAFELLAAAVVLTTCTIQLWICSKGNNQNKEKKTTEKVEKESKDLQEKEGNVGNESDNKNRERKNVESNDNVDEQKEKKQEAQHKEVESKATMEERNSEARLKGTDDQNMEQQSITARQNSSIAPNEREDNVNKIPDKPDHKIVVVEKNESEASGFDDFVKDNKQGKKERKPSTTLGQPNDKKNDNESEKRNRGSASGQDVKHKFEEGAGPEEQSADLGKGKMQVKEEEITKNALACKQDNRGDNVQNDREGKVNKKKENMEESTTAPGDEENFQETKDHLVPKKFAKGLKEAKIAKGARVRKTDYRTMDDIESDWGTEGEQKEGQRREKRERKAPYRCKQKQAPQEQGETPQKQKEAPLEQKKVPQERKKEQGPGKPVKPGRKCLVDSLRVSVEANEDEENKGAELGKQQNARREKRNSESGTLERGVSQMSQRSNKGEVKRNEKNQKPQAAEQEENKS